MTRGMPARGNLRREMHLADATALGIGAIVGSGIFVVTGIVAGVAGPALVVSIVIASAIALLSALSVAELSAYLPAEGGTYAFAGVLIAPAAGFIAGWIWVFSNIFVGAAVALGFAQYFAGLVPAVPVKAIAVAVCILFLSVNYRGLKGSVLFNNALVSVKVLIILFFAAFGLGFVSPAHLTPFAPAGTAGILKGAALIFFAYTGFARVTIVAEEVVEPAVTIPRSILLALGISTVLYLVTGAIAVGLAGAPALAASGSPLADAIRVTGSPAAVLLVSAGALIATASVLLTTILGVSRILFAMARNRDLPGSLARIDPRSGTPHFALAVTGACMIAAILLLDLALVVAVSTFAMLVFYFIANIAALRLPRDHRRYPAIVPAAGAATCVGLAVFLGITSWAIGIAGLVTGAAWYAIRHRKTGRPAG